MMHVNIQTLLWLKLVNYLTWMMTSSLQWGGLHLSEMQISTSKYGHDFQAVKGGKCILGWDQVSAPSGRVQVSCS